tara:strand:+ start:300 stop:788 length:489 start_codon:yes stop_codon:yes gene_type:complete
MKGIGAGKQIPVLTKVAKLETSLETTTAGTDTGDITFDKEVDEVVLIYAMECVIQSGNGMGTGTQVYVTVSRDPDQDAIDFDDEDTMEAWHFWKSFVTSGMEIQCPNMKKDYNQPMITSRPQLRVVAKVDTASWSTGKTNVYIWYTTRKLDAEARRILIGGT